MNNNHVYIILYIRLINLFIIKLLLWNNKLMSRMSVKYDNASKIN